MQRYADRNHIKVQICSPLRAFLPCRLLIMYLKQPILLPIHRPLLTPTLHLLPALRTPHIYSGNDLVNMQRTTEHCQFSEAAVLAVRYSEAIGLSGTASLRHQFGHGVSRFPIIRIQDRLYRW